MNIIRGYYDGAGLFGGVFFDGRRLDPGPSQKIRNHSPDGFAWGYSGSGPAQLALAILLAAGLDKETAQQHYQKFKAEFIAPLDQETFQLEVDVKAWVASQS